MKTIAQGLITRKDTREYLTHRESFQKNEIYARHE